MSHKPYTSASTYRISFPLITIAAVAGFIFAALPAHALPEKAIEAREQARQLREHAQQVANERQAQHPPAQAESHRSERAQEVLSEREEITDKSPQKHEINKLKDKNLKACQNREQAIQNIMARMSDRGIKQLDVLSKTSDRIQTYYKTHNLTAKNYDALVATVNTHKVLAEDAVTTAHQTSFAFDCESDNPKGTAILFKEDLRQQNARLKEYLAAIKNLIVAVRSAQPSTTGVND